MDNDSVAIRLKGFIDSEGLSHSQFADKCRIPRPSLSQILSGRNKKISDVIIGQIHRAFPDLSVLWLLFGEGGMRVGVRGISFPSSPDGDESAGDQVVSPDGVRAGVGLGSTGGVAYSGFGSVADPEFLPEGDESAFLSFQDDGFAGNHAEKTDYPNVRALNTPSKALQIAEKQLLDAENKIAGLQMQIDEMRRNPRKVSHITVYYDDSTFETFFSKS